LGVEACPANKFLGQRLQIIPHSTSTTDPFWESSTTLKYKVRLHTQTVPHLAEAPFWEEYRHSGPSRNYLRMEVGDSKTPVLSTEGNTHRGATTGKVGKLRHLA